MLNHSFLISKRTFSIFSNRMESSKLKVLEHYQYVKGRLEESDLDPNPLKLMQNWLMHARHEGGVKDPEVVSLATATKDGIPSNRMVLLKQIEADKRGGLVFFTNYESRKGNEMSQNPYAAMCIYWKEVERQIRAVGKIEKVSFEETNEYFKTRPLGSRIGAHVSLQSQPLPSRKDLEDRYKELESKFKDTTASINDLNAPWHWGGYRIIPLEIEFWQGRESRLHDRFQFKRKNQDSEWIVNRLSP